MIDSDDCIRKYGPASNKNTNLVLWRVPDEVCFGPIPKKIFCNKDLPEVLIRALRLVKSRGLKDQIKTWDGCYNLRCKRGYEAKYNAAMLAGDLALASVYLSIHSFGLAIDINASENPLGHEPKMSPELVKCFTDAGFDWGGSWKRKDGMHFQLAHI